MIQFIEKLREKPIEHKRTVALLSTSVITGAIFVAWITSQPFSIGSQSQVAGTAAAPLNAVGENIGATYDSLKDQFSTMQDEYNAVVGATVSEPDTSSVDPLDNFSIDVPKETE